jgi:hypothetical protein
MSNMVPAEHFMATIAVNVDNEKLSDADFRQFIRNTLPIVQYKRKRTTRCPHGVAPENHCERCD